MNTRFIQILLLSATVCAINLIAHKSNASDSLSNTPMYVYYEDIYFTEAYTNQDPKNAVSAATLSVAKRLPSDVNIEFLPTARLNIKFEEETENSVCALFKLKSTERESKYYFSLPIGFMQTHRLFLRQDMAPLHASLVNKEGEVIQIASLFDFYPEAKIILWENISHGDYLDNALKQVANKNKAFVQGMTSHVNLAKLVVHSRADFAIMPPAELVHVEGNSTSMGLMSYRIAGIEPVIKVYMMCNKNEASKKLVNAVNAVIRDLYNSPEYMSASLLNVVANEVPFVVDAINKVKMEIE